MCRTAISDGFTVPEATAVTIVNRAARSLRNPARSSIFLYPANKRTSSRRNIEEIRRASCQAVQTGIGAAARFRPPGEGLF